VKRPTKQDILGDWSVSTWLYACGCLACAFAILAFIVIYVLPLVAPAP
jgi:hypothetical protein